MDGNVHRFVLLMIFFVVTDLFISVKLLPANLSMTAAVEELRNKFSALLSPQPLPGAARGQCSMFP